MGKKQDPGTRMMFAASRDQPAAVARAIADGASRDFALDWFAYCALRVAADMGHQRCVEAILPHPERNTLSMPEIVDALKTLSSRTPPPQDDRRVMERLLMEQKEEAALWDDEVLDVTEPLAPEKRKAPGPR